MRKTIRHGATLHCDVPGCASMFTTYSVVSLCRLQAANASWGRIKLGAMWQWESFGLGSSKTKRIDVCPEHVPRSVMEGAQP